MRVMSGLAAGSALAGVLAYVFFAIVTRTIGAEAAAPVSVLWTLWGFSGAAITFPMQHWIARCVAADGHEGGVRRELPRVAGSMLAVSVAVAVVSWVLRHRLFGPDEPGFPAAAGAVVLGAGVMGVLRGLQTARERFGAVGAGLVAENLLRVIAALAMAAAGVTEPLAYAGCLLVGYAAALGWPNALVPAAPVSGSGEATPDGPGAGADTRSAALAFLGAAAAGQLASQAVLTGGPVVLALAGGTAASVTTLFAAQALFRAPYQFSIGMMAPVTARLTELVTGEDRARLGRLMLLAAAGLSVLVVVAAAVGAWLGPVLVPWIFGAELILEAAPAALIAVGSLLAIANLLLTLLMLALDRAHACVLAWLVAALPGAAWFVLSGADLLTRTAAAFAIIEAAATLALLLAGRTLLNTPNP